MKKLHMAILIVSVLLFLDAFYLSFGSVMEYERDGKQEWGLFLPKWVAYPLVFLGFIVLIIVTCAVGVLMEIEAAKEAPIRIGGMRL